MTSATPDLDDAFRPIDANEKRIVALKRANVVRLDTVQPERVSWLWSGFIPLGKLTVLDGDPGLGKSTLTLDLAARVTTGRPMPDGSLGVTGSVLILTAEDGLADTVRPRFDAARGDAMRLHAMQAVTTPDGERLPELLADVDLIEEAIRENDVRLVVIDPLFAFIGDDTNSHKDQSMRRALTPLAAMAERTGAAVVVVRHLNKAAGGSALYRGGGTIAIAGAARSVLLLGRDPDNADARVIASTKSNLGPPPASLRFVLVPDAAGGASAIEWQGACTVTADALLAVPATGEDRSALDEAVQFLRDALAEGPRPTRDITNEARAAGISDASLRRARHALSVRSSKRGMDGGWSLALPEERPKALNGAEGAHTRRVSVFGDDERLRSEGDPEAYDPEAPGGLW